jgi:hypothetical protein
MPPFALSLAKRGGSDNRLARLIHDVRDMHRAAAMPATILQRCFQNRAPIAPANDERDDSSKKGVAMNEDTVDWMTREREEIAARVASFRATQKRFEKEREEYYAATLGNAWDGFNRPVFWS